MNVNYFPETFQLSRFTIYEIAVFMVAPFVDSRDSSEWNDLLLDGLLGLTGSFYRL